MNFLSYNPAAIELVCRILRGERMATVGKEVDISSNGMQYRVFRVCRRAWRSAEGDATRPPYVAHSLAQLRPDAAWYLAAIEHMLENDRKFAAETAKWRAEKIYKVATEPVIPTLEQRVINLWWLAIKQMACKS